MRINSIKLINFRQYKNVDLEFEHNKENNVTIIIGDNGFGKTTLVRSFLWCLFKSNSFNDKILLNRDIANSMKLGDEKPVKAILEIEHDFKTYVITTEEYYKKSNNNLIVVSKKCFQNMVVIDENGTKTIPPVLFQAERDRILKEELSPFLFYDGENNKIENSNGSKKMKDAVYSFMGIQKIINMNTQFDPSKSGTVIRSLQNELKSDDDLKMTELLDKREEEQKNKDKVLEQVKQNQNQIDELNIQIKEKENILDANRDIEKDQLDKKKIEKKLNNNKEEILKKFQYAMNITNGRTNNMLRQLFAFCYKSKNIESYKAKSTFKSENSLSHISEEVIDQLINRGYCLCGEKIEQKNKAYEHLIEAKNHMEPHDFGKYLNDFCQFEEGSYSNVKYNTYKSSMDAYNDFLDLVEEHENSREALENLIEKISGRPDIGNLQDTINNYKLQIKGLSAQNEYIQDEQIPQFEKKIDRLSREIEICAKDNEENLLINKCLKYAKAIQRRTNTRIKQKKQLLKESLSSNTSEIFKNMYHGKRDIMLNDDFQLITLFENQSIDNSTGIETVKNFAFVTALMKTLKELKIMGIDDSDDYEEVYPLIIDAPFSNTDNEHITNICNSLPKYCSQLIMVVMEKDYKNAYKGLSGHINHVYKIEKHSETYDTIEESEQ